MSGLEYAKELSIAWLQGEHSYQFGKNDAAFGDQHQKRLDYIAKVELPDKWKRVVIFRQNEALDQSNQSLFKILAGARAIIVMSDLIEGLDPLTSKQDSFVQVQAHLDAVDETDLSAVTKLYNPSFRQAVVNDLPTEYVGPLACLAVNALIETEQLTGRMSLPRPGLPSGDLQHWNYIGGIQ